MMFFAPMLQLYFYMYASQDRKLEKLQDSFFEYLLSENPEFASTIGDDRFADRVDDYSMDTFDRWKCRTETTLKQLLEIRRYRLSEERKMDYDYFKNYLEIFLDGYRWRMYSSLTPVNILSRPQSLNIRMINSAVLSNEKDYENFIRRIQKYPKQIAQMIRRMKRAIELNRTLHRVSMERVPGLLNDLIGRKTVDCFLYKPFKDNLSNITTISENKKFKLRRQALLAIDNYVQAVRHIRDFILNVYIRHTRPSLGVESWQNGENLYMDIIKFRLSFPMTPEMIHQIGLSEVERISVKIKTILNMMGLSGTLKESFDFLKMQRQFFLETGEQMVERYDHIIQNDIKPKLDLLFKDIPRTQVIVRPTLTDGVFAFYQPPNLQGSRPGVFNLNTFHPDQSPIFTFKAIALHETYPGHHLQLTTTLNADIPLIRRLRMFYLRNNIPATFPTFTAYVEGWGLYSEYLGEEMGLYRSYIEILGRYDLEILRACRLVVDTGLHHFNWTRQHAIEYLSNYTSLGDSDMSFEVDRYVTLPGQALAYKIGEIKFLELRRKAEHILGDRFDIRDFHSIILQSGPMSFSQLETVVNQWVARRLYNFKQK